MPPIARKTDPALWRASKEEACKRAGLCLHSARKMQWAVRHYKAQGGGYAGPRSPDNRLVRWSRQRWRTATGEPSRGRRRYLPDAAWRSLSPRDVRRTNAAKAAGHRAGKQYVRQPRDIARRTRRHRQG